jgi:hypothetical protein
VYVSSVEEGPVKSSKMIPALPFTNHTPHFTGVIDYIWYTSDTLSIASVLGGILLGLPTEDQARSIRSFEQGELNRAKSGTLPVEESDAYLLSPGNKELYLRYLMARRRTHKSVPGEVNVSRLVMSSGKIWNAKGNRIIGFPNPAFPSDHVPVCSEIKWRY